MKLAFLKAIALASAAISAHAGRIQFEDLTIPCSAAANRDSVVRIFTDSYNEYRCARNFGALSMGLSYGPYGRPGCHRNFAFGHDEVAPISSNYSDLYSGWGSSIVDGMSTMVRAITSHYYLLCVLGSLMILVHHGPHGMAIAVLFFSSYDKCPTSRISLTKRSTSHKILTTQQRKPPTMSGNTPSVKLSVVGHGTDDALQRL